jgi:hypothetical protein
MGNSNEKKYKNQHKRRKVLPSFGSPLAFISCPTVIESRNGLM